MGYSSKHLKSLANSDIFEIDVRMGRVDNYRAITIRGTNSDVDSAEETVWTTGGLISFPDSTQTLRIASESTDDTVGGVGAQSVYILGLDDNWEEQSEIIELNGQTFVTSSLQYRRVNSFRVASAGANGSNQDNVHVGTGSVTAGVPSTIYKTIPTNANWCFCCNYTVPANMNMILLDGTFTSPRQRFVTLRPYLRANNGQTTPFADGIWYRMFEFHVHKSTIDSNFRTFRALPEKTDFEVRALCNTSNAIATARVEAFLVED